MGCYDLGKKLDMKGFASYGHLVVALLPLSIKDREIATSLYSIYLTYYSSYQIDLESF